MKKENCSICEKENESKELKSYVTYTSLKDGASTRLRLCKTCIKENEDPRTITLRQYNKKWNHATPEQRGTGE